MTGTVLANRYTIHEELGTGGMATVYRANCAYLQRDVAIKMLRPEYRNDADLVRRFESEARAAASLTHPNIVQIYDVGKENGVDYIVMELVDGRSLKELLTEHGPMPWQMAVDVALKVTSALQRAHAKQIVHRDIKPQNILLTADGEPKVADFGIARITTSGMETTKVDTVASVHYASPEQVRGGYTDAQSDLYSLGVTLFEMLTGTLPYAGDNPVSVALRHIQDDIPRVNSLNPEIPSALADVVLTCMQKKRADRYPDAATLISDLEQIRHQPEAAIVQRASTAQAMTGVTVMAGAAGLSGATARAGEAEDVGASDSGKVYSMGVSEPVQNGVSGTPESRPSSFAAGAHVLEADVIEVPVRRHAMEPAGAGFSVVEPAENGFYVEEAHMGGASPRRSAARGGRQFNPKKMLFPLLYIGLIGLIIALISGIIRFVAKDLGASASPSASVVESSTAGRQEFEVEDYRGQSLDQVVETLPEGLKYNVFYIEDATVEKDHVIRQSPMGGSKIVVGGLTTMELFVSSGVDSVAIPEIDGRKQPAILVELRDDLGLLVEQKFEYSDVLEADSVIRLDPPSGTMVSEGSTVTMHVSLGKEQKTVSAPDLANLDRKTAEAKLAEYKLAVGSVTPSDTPQTGRVLLTQSIKPGDLVPEGTVVNLTFELPPVDPTPLPSTEPTSEPSVTPAPTDSGPALAKVTIPVDWQDDWKSNAVQLTVVVYGKQSGLDEVILDAKIRKDDFPYNVLITIPEGGGTVRIYVNGDLYKEKEI